MHATSFDTYALPAGSHSLSRTASRTPVEVTLLPSMPLGRGAVVIEEGSRTTLMLAQSVLFDRSSNVLVCTGAQWVRWEAAPSATMQQWEAAEVTLTRHETGLLVARDNTGHVFFPQKNARQCRIVELGIPVSMSPVEVLDAEQMLNSDGMLNPDSAMFGDRQLLEGLTNRPALFLF